MSKRFPLQSQQPVLVVRARARVSLRTQFLTAAPDCVAAWSVATRVVATCLCALVVSLSPAAAVAQVAPPVDSTRVPVSRRDSAARRVLPRVSVTGQRLRAAPPPVAMIAADTTALLATPASSAYDLIRRVTGLEVHEQGQGPGFTSNAVLRGFNSDHSADVLLVVDGIPINAPVHGHVEGFADWNVLVPAAVQSLRVIHGGASPLYGDFALAGVVEVFTAADGNGVSSALTSSSFGDVGGWLRAGTRRENHGALFAIDGRRGEGWQQHAQSFLGNALVRGWRTVAGGRLEGGVHAYGSTWDSPGFVSIARYNTRDLRRAVDSTDGGESQRLMSHMRYARNLGTVRGRALSGEITGWLQSAASDWYLTVPGEGLIVRQARERDERVGVGGQAQALLALPKGQLLAGLAWRADEADYLREATLARQATLTDHSYDARYSAQSAFVRLQHLAGSRIALDLGARVDHLQYRIDDRLDARAPQRKNSNVVSPKFGVRYLTPFSPRGTTISLLGSVAQGFRGAVGVIADPTRAPFLAWSREAGVVLESEHTHLHAALFHTTVRNERVFNAATLGVSSAGRSRRQGIDLRGRLELPAQLRRIALFGAATLNDARFLKSGGSDTGRVIATPQNTIHDHNIPIVPGDPVPGVARYTARVGLVLPLSAQRTFDGNAADNSSQLRLTYRVLGPFTPVGEPGLQTRTASVLDLGASVPIRLRQRGGSAPWLDVELQNVLNLRYVENRASGFITPGAPRVVRIGFRVGTPAGVTPDGAVH